MQASISIFIISKIMQVLFFVPISQNPYNVFGVDHGCPDYVGKLAIRLGLLNRYVEFTNHLRTKLSYHHFPVPLTMHFIQGFTSFLLATVLISASIEIPHGDGADAEDARIVAPPPTKSTPVPKPSSPPKSTPVPRPSPPPAKPNNPPAPAKSTNPPTPAKPNNPPKPNNSQPRPTSAPVKPNPTPTPGPASKKTRSFKDIKASPAAWDRLSK
jgi:hypothetical protein